VGRLLSPSEVNAHVAAKMHFAAGAEDPVAATTDICGLRADDAPGPFLSLFARVRRFAHEDLEDLLRRGHLVRVKAVRGTFFVLTRPLLGEFLGACALDEAEAQSELARYGIDAKEATKLAAAVYDHIPRGGATSAEIRRDLPEGAARVVQAPGEKTPKSAVQVTLSVLAARGLLAVHKDAAFPDLLPLEYNTQMREVVRPNRYHRLDRLLPSKPRLLPRARARAAVIRRYLARYGPVSEADVVTWTSFPKGEVASILKRIAPGKVRIAGLVEELLVSPRERVRSANAGAVTFLPVGDSYTKGYEACPRLAPLRDWYIARYWPTVFVGGELVGVWRYSCRGRTFRLLVTAFPWRKGVPRQEITAAGLELAGFLSPESEATVAWAPELYEKLKPGTARL